MTIDTLIIVGIFIIALGVLIFIHELGHFIMAKRAGVRVETFSLGFGPGIGVRRGETFYKISILPLGGYVKMTGEDPASEEATHPGSFAQKSLRARFGVVFAGPLMNIVMAFVLMPVIFMMGRPTPAYLEKIPVVVDMLSASPAAEVGLQSGDKILSIDGDETQNWGDLIRLVLLRPDQSVEIVWERDGQTIVKTVTIKTYGKEERGILGIEPDLLIAESTLVYEVSPGSAADEAGVKTGDQIFSINGRPIETWSEMSEQIQLSEGRALTVTLNRNGHKQKITLKPQWDKKMNRYLIGVSKLPVKFVIKKFPFLKAIKEGTLENFRLIGLTMRVLGRLVTFRLSYKSLGGPVRIAKVFAQAAETGFVQFLFFMSFLSIQLGILNLLPIPVLDGGWSVELDSLDPQTIVFAYPSAGIANEMEHYIRPAIRLEMGARSDDWPAADYNIKPYAAEVFPETFIVAPTCRVHALDAERTFWEKATLLHAEYHRPRETPTRERLARHYYDLHQLSKTDIATKALKRMDLLERVALHKKVFFRSAWANYETAKPGSFRLVPSGERLSALRSDYSQMQAMIFGDYPEWEAIVEGLEEIEGRINSHNG